MAKITRRHIFKDGNKPRDYELNGEFDNILTAINGGLNLDNFTVDAGNRLVVNITGDSTTVGGLTVEQIVAGDYTDLKHNLADIANDFIYKGGLAVKDINTANFLNVSECTAYFRGASGIIRVVVSANSFTTVAPSTLHYLDLTIGGAFHFGAAHAAGTYLPLATVLTDATSNISTVTDLRNLDIVLFGDGDAKVTFAKEVTMNSRRLQVMGV